MGISDTVAARCSSAVDNACIVLSNYQATIMISLQLSAVNHILFFISEIFYLNHFKHFASLENHHTFICLGCSN